MKHLYNIYRLGIKELRSLWHDKVMVILIIYSFTIAIYIGATAASTEIHNAPIAFIDEDRSKLSEQIIDAFYPPRFKSPTIISSQESYKGLDTGLYTFVITIPTDFQKKLTLGKRPTIQVNTDATRMTQAGIGTGYIQRIINNEINNFLHKSNTLPVSIITRMKYNPNLTSSWFGSVMEIISMVTLLSIILSGAALIREREHGTLEHLMVMPLSAMEIILSKIWSMGLVVLIAAGLSLLFVVEGILEVPIAGSETLFLFGALLVLFATTSMGIFIGTVAKTMPQLGLIFILTILPLQILSGSITPYESMPLVLQKIMLIAPTSHFVSMAQAVLYRGAGFDIVWPNLVAIFAIGLVFFLLALFLFRRSLSSSS
ncbi:MAG: ABC transporter permease [Sulfurimonas sp.]|nr:ABC transporter permease [Sulfurimonas sp.]